ncbi:MAG: hypothetical protein Kow0025_11140 [Thermodesulfovibrionales bacterium]
MEKQYREFGDRVEFLGICIGVEENMPEYVRENGVTMPVAYDGGREVTSSFGAKIPTFMLVDRAGKIIYESPSPPDMEGFLGDLLGEPGDRQGNGPNP